MELVLKQNGVLNIGNLNAWDVGRFMFCAVTDKKLRHGQRTKHSSAFIGDGCLAGAAGLRHDQHLLLLLLLPCCCCWVRVRGVGFFFS